MSYRQGEKAGSDTRRPQLVALRNKIFSAAWVLVSSCCWQVSEDATLQQTDLREINCQTAPLLDLSDAMSGLNSLAVHPAQIGPSAGNYVAVAGGSTSVLMVDRRRPHAIVSRMLV